MNNTNKVNLIDLSEFSLYFPDVETTVSGVNPISIPGIFMMLTGSNYSYTGNMTAISVAGYKAIIRPRVIAFVDNVTNRAYYCYEGQLQDDEKDLASGGVSFGTGSGRFHVEDFFSSTALAANAISPTANERYAPYYEIMARKIKDTDD